MGEAMQGVPKGLQVVKLTDDHSYILDEPALERILLRDDVKDLPVVVVSVAGPFRSGKSFLLNFFLRYLNAPESSKHNKSGEWLGPENKPLTGFSWCGGSIRHTTGIVMWSDPFVCNLPSGEKVAVLLMDTQGTFNNRSSMRDCSTIFALSTLLSSVQIYNLSGNIKEHDLQYLQIFTEYGRRIQNEDGEKAFQELLFLIRDWQYDYEYSFGRTGGDQVLENSLKISEEQTEEMRVLRQSIRSCFERIGCFLMPYPGRNVRKPKFDGRISDLDPEFKMALLDLIPSVFSSEKLVPKLINGERVIARDLLTYFKSYMEIFNSDKVPSPMSIVEATLKAAMLSGVREARALYESIMEQKCGPKQPSWPKIALNDVHNTAVNAARNNFTSKRKMGSIKDRQAYLEQLTQDLETRLSEFLIMNENKVVKAIAEAKEVYEAYVHAVRGKEMLCLHPIDLENVHKEALAEAIKVFDSKRQQFLTVRDEERATFLESFNKELDDLRSTNDINNRLVVSEIRTNYSKIMSNLCAMEPPLGENEYLEEHKKALANAISSLDKKRNRISNYDEDSYKTEMSQLFKFAEDLNIARAVESQIDADLLQNDINKFKGLDNVSIMKILKYYMQMSSINRSKNMKALQQALSFYDNYMMSFWDPTTCCLHPNDLKQAHDTAKRQALQMFHPNQQSDELVYKKMLISQITDFKYRDWTDFNKSANESAVTAAYNEYYTTMKYGIKFTSHNVSAFSVAEYHKKNKEAALVIFKSKRRDTTNQEDYDPYFQDLVQKIDIVYNSYLSLGEIVI